MICVLYFSGDYDWRQIKRMGGSISSTLTKTEIRCCADDDDEDGDDELI